MSPWMIVVLVPAAALGALALKNAPLASVILFGIAAAAVVAVILLSGADVQGIIQGF